jgi:tRNA 2-thiouridine synthesizing protein A
MERYIMAEYDQELDACGLNCPLPILRAKKSLSTMETGQILHVVATDPGAIKDFEAFSNQTGNKLMDSREDSGKFYFLIQKA